MYERRNFQNGVQETAVVAPQVRLLGLAVHVQNSKKYAQDDGDSGENSRRHDGDRAAVVALEQQQSANDCFWKNFPMKAVLDSGLRAAMLSGTPKGVRAR